MSQWTVYDGRPRQGPRAAALRAVCSCARNGPEQRLDCDAAATLGLDESGARALLSRFGSA
ncbi:hypothetical protein ABT119_09425 [Streptomyces sp. NPDC001910]|uniref:hypothetical protein n=1 Tax=Streptomyces sp. NPDC001910 TaxID=3154403 RepID=UPI0033295AB8